MGHTGKMPVVLVYGRVRHLAGRGQSCVRVPW